MVRTILPTRRPSLIVRIPYGPPGITYHVSVGFNDANLPMEVFIACSKTTSSMETIGYEAAILLSIALQYGASLKELAKSLPAGPIQRDDGSFIEGPIGLVGVIVEAIQSAIEKGIPWSEHSLVSF